VASPSLGRGEFWEFVYAHGSSVQQKCSNYALANLLFGLCKSLWIIDLLITRPIPHLGSSTRPSTLEVLQVREHTPTPSFIIFTFRFTFESFKECGVHQFSSPSTKIWWWHPLAPINNKIKRKKKLGFLLCWKLVMEPTCTYKEQNIEKKERKRGAWVFAEIWWWFPPDPRNNEKKRKKRGIGFYWKLVMAPTETKTKT
jgi:hypothetical protein